MLASKKKVYEHTSTEHFKFLWNPCTHAWQAMKTQDFRKFYFHMASYETQEIPHVTLDLSMLGSGGSQ